MSAERLFGVLRLVSVLLWLIGLTLAEFGKLHALGMIFVLLGIAAAGGAGSLYVIVSAREKQIEAAGKPTNNGERA